MIPSSRRPEPRRRLGRWLLSLAAIALMPKCAACLLAYLGLASLLGLGGPEWCGAADNGPSAVWFGIGGLLLSVALWRIVRNTRRSRTR